MQHATDDLIRLALAEDVGPGDWTTQWTVPADRRVGAHVLAKAPGVLSGVGVAERVFRLVDPALEVDALAADGDPVAPGDRVMAIRGSARSILTAERVALNFLQRLSGIATLTRAYASLLAGTRARVLDTRKTTPGMRELEKAAVRHGGGHNHRFGLHDMVLIKENHIAAAGGITEAVEAVRRANEPGLKVEVEATNLPEVEEALRVGVDRILFDNMPLPMLHEAVRRTAEGGGGGIETEASGGINLQTARAIAESGVDYLSVGALTHSAPALDLSLLVEL